MRSRKTGAVSGSEHIVMKNIIWRMARAVIFLLSLSLVAACSSVDEDAPANGNDHPAVNSESPAASFYAGRLANAAFPVPDSAEEGRFAVDGDCLIFISKSGARYLPLFPAETRFDTNPGAAPFARVAGAELYLGRDYRMEGGVGEYSPRQ